MDAASLTSPGSVGQEKIRLFPWEQSIYLGAWIYYYQQTRTELSQILGVALQATEFVMKDGSLERLGGTLLIFKNYCCSNSALSHGVYLSMNPISCNKIMWKCLALGRRPANVY